MVKKKIVFVMGSLGIGGAEKSLLSLISNIDYELYDVDLMLFNKNGEWNNLVEKEVNILYPTEDYIKFDLDPVNSLLYFAKKCEFKMFYFNLMYLIKLFFNRFILKKEYIGWEVKSKMMDSLKDSYDMSIGFLEKQCTYFSVDKVKSKKKIGWIHTDYNSIGFDYKTEMKYLGELDNIITVSDSCQERLCNIFPMYKDKIMVIKNIVSPNLIIKQANNNVNECISLKDDNKITIATVARLTEQKGIEIAIDACKSLIDRGYKVKWIVVGEGSERGKLEERIKSNELEKDFNLIGSRVNPYPYIKNCDIYVQPSRWEGFGITVLEAKILNKPIIVSNIPEFREQIVNNENGLIFNDTNELVKDIINIMENDLLSEKLRSNLLKESYDNSVELNKLLNLI